MPRLFFCRRKPIRHMFIDEIKIYAKAGHGGKGCVAFHREAFVAKGGPSGGNGGRGGNVILQADHDLNNLIAQYYQPRLIAQDGEMGMGKGMDGHAGKDLVVKVPCGTLVWQLNSEDDSRERSPAGASEEPESALEFRTSGSHRPLLRTAAVQTRLESEISENAVEQADSIRKPHGDLLADLTTHGQRLTLCKGGRGGLGNRNFATAARQAPRFAQPGEQGEEGD